MSYGNSMTHFPDIPFLIRNNVTNAKKQTVKMFSIRNKNGSVTDSENAETHADKGMLRCYG